MSSYSFENDRLINNKKSNKASMIIKTNIAKWSNICVR